MMATDIEWPPKLKGRQEKIRAAAGLTAKSDGWYKSLRGKTRYICKPMPIADAVKVLAVKRKRYEQPHEPRYGKVVVGKLTLERLVETFLEDAWQRHLSGSPKKLERRTYEGYADTLARFCGVVGCDRHAASIGPDDFTAFVRSLDGRSGTTLRREMQYVDRLFNWAGPGKRYMNLIPYAQRGPNWIKPEGVGVSDKSYTIDRLQEVFAAVAGDRFLNACAHLGYGSGFIPKDVATLREDQVDLAGGVIVFPRGRGKTGEDRLCPLSGYAVGALEDYLAVRPAKCEPEAAGLFFRTATGLPLLRWHEGDSGPAESNLVKLRWGAMIRERFGLKANLPYTGLRTTLASVLDDWGDQRAVDVILGHKSGEKAKHIRTVHYARQFNPDRARRAVDYAYALVFHGPLPYGQPSPRFLSEVPGL